MELAYAVSVFVSIFAIANPIGIIPFFTAITRDYSPDEQRQVATKAVVAATGTLIIFALVGRYIFLFFSITIPAFRIAGPGTISTVMLFISRGDLGVTLVVLGSILIIMGITYICLANADRIFARMGKVGALAISRIMGLILATVAIQFLINGAHEIAVEWLTELQTGAVL